MKVENERERNQNGSVPCSLPPDCSATCRSEADPGSVCRLVRERLKNDVEKMRNRFSGFRPGLVVLQVRHLSPITEPVQSEPAGFTAAGSVLRPGPVRPTRTCNGSVKDQLQVNH